MKIAAFSDIHGNLFALETVLAAIITHGPFDHVAAAGDLCLGGSSPRRCVELLVENNSLLSRAIQKDTSRIQKNHQQISTIYKCGPVS